MTTLFPITQLQKIVRFHYGSALKAEDRHDQGPYTVFGSNGPVGLHSETLVEYPTIIIGRKGSVGSVHYAPDGGWPIDTTYYTEIIDGNNVDLRYLFHALNHAKLDRHTIVTSIPGLNRETLYRTTIPLPSLTEQQRIALILDKADAICRKREQAGHLAQTLPNSIYVELFGNPIHNPRRWPIAQINLLCNLVRGSSPRPKADPRYYGGPVPRLMVEDLTRDGRIVTPKVDSLTEEGAKLSRPVVSGTVVMVVSGRVGEVARLAIDACIHDGFVAFKNLDNDRVNPDYLIFCLHQMRSTHQRNMAGAIWQNLTTDQIKAMEIPLPPLHLQEHFAYLVARSDHVRKKIQDEREADNRLWQSLIHQAFRGEL